MGFLFGELVFGVIVFGIGCVKHNSAPGKFLKKTWAQISGDAVDPTDDV